MSESEPPCWQERGAANGTMIAAKQRQGPKRPGSWYNERKRSLYRVFRAVSEANLLLRESTHPAEPSMAAPADMV